MEVIRETRDLSAEYRVIVNGSDDRINYQVNSELSWSQPTADEGFSAMQIGTVSGLALFAIIGLILFLKRDDIDEENMYEEDYPEEDNTPVHGPPATAFTGPPATTTVQEDPMAEYQRQLEEYNKKMAEYTAWQHAQGSQVTHDTTNHE